MKILSRLKLLGFLGSVSCTCPVVFKETKFTEFLQIPDMETVYGTTEEPTECMPACEYRWPSHEILDCEFIGVNEDVFEFSCSLGVAHACL